MTNVGGYQIFDCEAKFVDILCLETEAYVVVVEVKKEEVSWVAHLPKLERIHLFILRTVSDLVPYYRKP
jgi:hypothetical protein